MISQFDNMGCRPRGFPATGRNRGVTLVEVMVASLILVVGMMGITTAWIFSMNLTRTTDETAVSFNIARSTVERIRGIGFQFTPIATTEAFYDSSGITAGKNGAYYRAVTKVSEAGMAAPPLDQKEIRVTVNRVSDGKVLFATRTYLTLGGL
jgi:prepilin-type N-terminal cleavage/methylation domain-containing protein